MTSILILGFLIGIRHAFEPDHVAAVASLSTRTSTLKQAVQHGAAWGLGHTLTLFAVCSIALVFNATLSEQLAHYLEAAVGAMLVMLGIDVLRRLYRDRVHFHAHKHGDGVTHFHAHSHKGEPAQAHDARHHDHQHAAHAGAKLGPRFWAAFPFRALAVGLMHGMAGSAALIVLTVQTVQSPALGLAYVALFGVGSIAGMALFSAIISIPMKRAHTLTWVHNGLYAAVGAGTAILGAMTLIDNLSA